VYTVSNRFPSGSSWLSCHWPEFHKKQSISILWYGISSETQNIRLPLLSRKYSACPPVDIFRNDSVGPTTFKVRSYSPTQKAYINHLRSPDKLGTSMHDVRTTYAKAMITRRTTALILTRPQYRGCRYRGWRSPSSHRTSPRCPATLSCLFKFVRRGVQRACKFSVSSALRCSSRGSWVTISM